MTQQELIIREVRTGKLVAFKREDDDLKVTRLETKTHVTIIYRQVLGVRFDPDSGVLEVAYLRRRKKRTPFALMKLEGKVEGLDSDAAADWAEALMKTVYEDSRVKRGRHLMVLVNPHGGVRKAVAVFMKVVEPIFRAAQCTFDIIHTTHNRHAYDIAKEMDLKYDAVVTVSGDGLIHEVMNGFAHHEDPKKAFAIPIAPIPTGSGNGLALNLLGIEHGFDVTEAALNVIKGKAMKVDVFSLTQDGERTISFMSQAMGLMADLDIGTEHLRWMGDTRFMFGLIRGIIQFKPCPVQLSYKLAEDDKVKMAETLEARRLEHKEGDLEQALPHQDNTGRLPPLHNLPDDTDGWTTFEEPILYIYAGKGPFVGRDLMAFPVSLPDDGLIDVMAMPVSSRKDILLAIGGAAKGENYWHPKVHYVKAHAYRVKPLASKGSLAVDGEVFPFKEFQVEVHQKLAAFLSPYGHYAANFSSPTSSAPVTSKKRGDQ